MKTDSEAIEKLLAFLADQLQVPRLSEDVLRGYVHSLEKFPPHVLIRICQKIRDSYRPFNNSFPPPSVFHVTLENEAIFAAPKKMWECRCCGTPFPAGMLVVSDNNGELKSGLRCKCDIEYCFRCEHCGIHCHCPEGLLDQYDSPELKEFNKLLDSLPTNSAVRKIGKSLDR